MTDQLIQAIVDNGFNYSDTLATRVESAPVITEEVFVKIREALETDVSNPPTDDEYGINTAYATLARAHGLTDLSLLCALPRIHQECSENAAKYANYITVSTLSSNSTIFLSPSRDADLSQLEALYAATNIATSLHFMEHLKTLSLPSVTNTKLLDVMEDKVAYAHDELMNYADSTRQVEKYYLSLRSSHLCSEHSSCTDVVKELLGAVHGQPIDFDWITFSDTNPELYLDTRTLAPEEDLSSVAITAQVEAMTDLRLTLQLHSILDPGTDQVALDVWRAPVEAILESVQTEPERPILLSSPQLRKTAPIDREGSISVDSLNTFDDPLGRSNAHRFFRSLMTELTEQSIDKILILEDWLITAYSPELQFFSAQSFAENGPVTGTEERDKLHRFAEITRDFFTSDSQSFASYLRRNGMLQTDTVPRSIAHVIETVDFLKTLDATIAFYKHRQDLQPVASGTVRISTNQATNSDIAALAPREYPRPIIISHALASPEDSDVAFQAEGNDRDVVRRKINTTHCELADKYLHDNTCSVATKTMPGDAFRTFHDLLTVHPFPALLVPSADFYVTTVSSEPDGSTLIEDPAVPDEVPEPVAG
jgi:hypothetical protein